MYHNHDKARTKTLKIEDRKGIKFSNALQMSDFSWIPAMHSVGSTGFPIVFNNACSSWIEMANKFIFAGASVYIGTTKDINNTLASSCGSRFVALALKRRSILYALFQVQKPYTEQLGYSPYLYWGYPDVLMKPIALNKKKLREGRVGFELRSWRINLLKCKDENKKKHIKGILDCISEMG